MGNVCDKASGRDPNRFSTHMTFPPDSAFDPHNRPGTTRAYNQVPVGSEKNNNQPMMQPKVMQQQQQQRAQPMMQPQVMQQQQAQPMMQPQTQPQVTRVF